MSSSFAGSSSDELRPEGSEPGPFDDDDRYTAYDPRLSSQSFDSQRFESFANCGDGKESTKEGVVDTPYDAGDEVFGSQPIVSPPSANSSGGVFSSERNGNGPILPPPADMQTEEGYALREWRRQNAIRLVEKEKREKEILKEIVLDAEEYKEEYYKKWKLRCESNRAVNREKEKSFLESREKFHAEVSKSYWKAIGELIPNEVPIIEKKGKKDQEKKPTIYVVRGPKPGKPTDLSRMRQILVKLKHNPPLHMKPPHPLLSETGRDCKTAMVPAAKNVPATSGVIRAAEVSSTTAK